MMAHTERIVQEDADPRRPQDIVGPHDLRIEKQEKHYREEQAPQGEDDASVDLGQ